MSPLASYWLYRAFSSKANPLADPALAMKQCFNLVAAQRLRIRDTSESGYACVGYVI